MVSKRQHGRTVAATLPDAPIFNDFLEKQSNVSAAIRYLIMDYMVRTKNKPEDLAIMFNLLLINSTKQ